MVRLLAMAGAIALLAAPSPASAQVLILEMLGLPSPTDVVKMIDGLTRKDSATSMDAKLGATVAQGKLLVARTRVEVTLERSTRNWRGVVEAHLTVPTDVTFSVNLATIRPEHIRVDSKRRLLTVTMPPPQVEDVTPLLPEMKVENSFRRGRFKRFDADASRELLNTMLKEDYQLRARKEGEARLPQVRQEARAALEGLLQTLLRANCPDVRVQAE